MMESSADMLFARLQLINSGARTFLVAAADSTDASPVARGLALAIGRSGLNARLVDLVGSSSGGDSPDGNKVARQVLGSDVKGNLSGLENALKGFNGYTVIVGGSLLDHAPSLLATKLSDGVVLLAYRGKTSRTDLARAKVEVERAGSVVLGAVLQD